MAKSFANDVPEYTSFAEPIVEAPSNNVLYSDLIAEKQADLAEMQQTLDNQTIQPTGTYSDAISGLGIVSNPTGVDDIVLETSKILRRDNDTLDEFEITLTDHDYALMYYIENIIKPTVNNNGTSIVVPLIYASSEKWDIIQKHGFYRDKKGKAIFPLMTFKRTGIQDNSSISMNKLDANNPHNVHMFSQKYSKDKPFSKFDLLNKTPQRGKIYTVQVPDYVVLSYECMVWTNFIEHMNPIVEKFNYAKKAYWGEPGKFNFYVNIDGFDNTTELSDGEDRLVRTTFTVTMNGYLIPKSFNNKSTSTIISGPYKLAITSEIVTKIT